MRVAYARAAVKVINSMDRSTKQRIKAGIKKLLQGDIKPYKGSPGTYWLQIGDWRILFSTRKRKKSSLKKLGRAAARISKGVSLCHRLGNSLSADLFRLCAIVPHLLTDCSFLIRAHSVAATQYLTIKILQ